MSDSHRRRKKRAKQERRAQARADQPVDRIDELITAFLDSGLLPDLTDEVLNAVDLIEDYCRELLIGTPLNADLDDWCGVIDFAVDGQAVLAEVIALPEVLAEWARFIAQQQDLDEEDWEDLEYELRNLAVDCRTRVDELSAEIELITAYVVGLDLGDREAVAEALDRRQFAVQSRDAEELRMLDPADPEDRGLLVRARHLDCPLAEGEDSDQHLLDAETVATQLWHDQPPELWRAAKRCRRHATGDAWHQMMAVLRQYRDDPVGYQRELNQLGR